MLQPSLAATTNAMHRRPALPIPKGRDGQRGTSPRRSSAARSTRPATAALAGLLAVVPGAPTRAQAPINDLGTVTVVAKVPRPLSEAAASVTVVDAAALDRLVVRDLADLARYEPGISLRNDATRFGGGDFTIRGVGGNRVLIEVDGVPSAPAFAVGSFADTGRTYLDLDLVRRVEILRGPASSLYGSDALGGVVSLQTFDPADLLSGGPLGFRLRSAYRGDDGGWLGTAIGAAQAGPARLLLGYARRDSGQLDNGSASLEPNPRDRTSEAWLGKAVYGDSNPVRLTLQRQEARTRTDVRSLLLQPGRFANTTAMRGDDAARSTLAALDQTLTDAGPFAQAEWRAYWRRGEVDQDTREQRRAAGPRAPAVALFREFRFEDRTVGLEATGSHEFRALGADHRLFAGVEADRSSVRERRDGLQTTLATGATTTVILGEAFPLRDFPQTVVTRVGLHLQDRIATPGRGAWIPAVRVDHYRLRPEVDSIYAEDNSRTQPVSLRETAVSPRLGWTYDLGQRATLYAQYSHGFRAPPFEDVNVGLDLPLFATRAIPNPDLKPEKSDGLELGLRAEGGPLRATASAFYNRYRDFIESKVNLGPDATGTTIFQSQNRARARIWGLEAAGTWDLGEPGGTLDGFFLRGALWYGRGDDTVRDRPLNSVDPPKLVFGGGYAAPSNRWGAALLTTTAAAQDRIDAGAVPPARAPGWTTIDVDAWWRPLEALELRIAVLNVADRSYYEWADVRGKAATDPSLELYRRPGRSIAAALTWSY
jgi:hemoglobin/transferrin/lactoferrin receptor protein